MKQEFAVINIDLSQGFSCTASVHCRSMHILSSLILLICVYMNYLHAWSCALAGVS